MKKYIAIILVVVLFQACTVVRPGEVGLKQTLGKLKPKSYQGGLYFFNPFISKFVKVDIRTTNLTNALENLPTKEGLTISAELAVLYHVKPENAAPIISTIGITYEETFLLSVLRSAAADITAKFYAKDMYTSSREEIEKEIGAEMVAIIGDRGFVIEHVLLKQITLPQGLRMSIESKLEAEQDAQRMEFVLNKEKKEAERKVIEAEGIKKSQVIISEGLTPQILQYKSIEAFKDLSASPNTKIIITNGKTPFLINTTDSAK